MAHFAEINSDNVVLRVIVVPDEHEADGEQWCADLFGGTWKQTSYNNTIRYNFAGIGYTYDAVKDAFIPPQPFASWLLDNETCLWTAPTPCPDDGKYEWNEETISWDAVE